MIHAAAVLTAVEVHREAAARPPAHVTVRKGDTLSGIAARYRIEWPGLYEANSKVVGANPNLLTIGERLRIPSAAAAVRLAESYRPAAVVVPVSPAPATPQPVSVQPASAQTQEVSEQQTEAQAPAPAQTQAPAQASAPAGSFQQCVISRESGGQSQVMNGSGHYGLYQFSDAAWVASGGNPADFGNASAAEQNHVFASAYAKFGTSPWAPYDGC